ncbi:MAG: hypothetical protein GF347_01780 [Candidatus Moranbacteria bacterium]|nr:hypothetical protein [Candidatus Moranbacteria bacterium]
MMNLTNTQINKFKKLWKKRFGVELSDDEARGKGIEVVQLVETVLKPKIKIKNKDHEQEIC